MYKKFTNSGKVLRSECLSTRTASKLLICCNVLKNLCRSEVFCRKSQKDLLLTVVTVCLEAVSRKLTSELVGSLRKFIQY